MVTDALLERWRRTSEGAAEGAGVPPPHLWLIPLYPRAFGQTNTTSAGRHFDKPLKNDSFRIGTNHMDGL